MAASIQGELERIVYTSEEDSYTVARIKAKGRRELITIVGKLISANPGETLKLTGEWTYHKKFGEQFRFDSYVSVAPATVNGIRKYLASGLIKGIGPVMAKRLVEKFGIETLDIIENNIERLIEVEGIGGKRTEFINKAWQEQKEIRGVMIFLQEYGVSAGYAAKIYKRYGNNSIPLVKENPYRLAADIQGIGFKTADQIAQKMGFETDSPARAQAGIVYVLNQLAEDGHVYYPYEGLIESSKSILEVEREVITKALASAFEEKRIFIEDLNEDIESFKENNKAVYLMPFYLSEAGIARKLKELKRSPSNMRKIDTEKALQWVQDQLKITLADKQREAVKKAATHKVMVITGGPGTGKTTIVKSIIKIHGQCKLRIALAAPTGRAAKRLSEATGQEAKTIHRLLEYSPMQGGFKKNQERPLPADVVIVDEASMIDTFLMYNLLKAIPSWAIFILVGDVNQLPSVGAGNVLKDIINSGAVGVVELTEIFRQARQSLIVLNAHKINQGSFPYLPVPARQTGTQTGIGNQGELSDFYFIQEEDPGKVVDLVKHLCLERLPKRLGYDPLKDIQVLTPMNRGLVGTANLNMELQGALNPNGGEISRMGRTFRINDKVMQIRNNYDKEVYNGDIGQVVGINLEGQEVLVKFDMTVKYEFHELDELVLAYAISVHKSQGSEYPAVVMPVMTQHYILLQRNLLYTAVTRAKSLVVLIGSKKALAMAVRNNKIQKRYTYLEYRLGEIPRLTAAMEPYS